MAGRARTKALKDELDKRAAAYFDTFDAPDVLGYVCQWIESGNTLKELAKELTDTLHDEVTYARLMAVLRDQHGEAATESAIELARARASHSFAEESLAIVDAPAETQQEVSRAASRARSRQWLAQSWNRRAYGQDKGVSVSVTVGSQWVEALRAHARIVTGSPQPALPAAQTPVDAEHEVL